MLILCSILVEMPERVGANNRPVRRYTILSKISAVLDLALRPIHLSSTFRARSMLDALLTFQSKYSVMKKFSISSLQGAIELFSDEACRAGLANLNRSISGVSA